MLAENVFLKPGELFFGKDPVVVGTVLGSCVAVTMFHKGRGIGAICHGQLPECRDSDFVEATSPKYVDVAINKLIKLFNREGVDLKEIEIKLFGGSEILKRGEAVQRIRVGKQNIDKATDILEKNELKISARDVGGPVGRKILFDVRNGNVFVKRLKDRSGVE
ncbi:MAG: chemotaxis protein CheD [Nitrospinota bacterium]